MAIKPISSFAPLPKIFVFIGLVVTHIFFFTMAGMLVGSSIWGKQYMNDISLLNDLSNTSTIAYLKFIQVFGQVGMIMGAFLFVYLSKNNINLFIGINRLPSPKSMIMAVVLILISLPLINYLSSVNAMVKLPVSLKTMELWFQDQEASNNRIIEAFLHVQTYSGLIANVIFIALFTAIVEEVVFRGVLQNLCSDLFKNKHIAVAVTAVTFALIHFQFYKLIPMLLLAFTLGYVYLWSGSIWLSIIIHFVNNALTVIVVYYYNKGLISKLFEDFGTRQQDTIVVIVSGITMGLIIYIIHKFEVKKVANI